MTQYIKTTLVAAALAIGCALQALADDVTMTVQAPSTVEAGGKFRVQFVVNTQNVSGFTAPSFKGFEVIYGPATSSQSSFQMINGRTSQSSSIIYSYVLLSDVPGTYTIGSASAQADGKAVKSQPVTVKVLSAGANVGSSGRGGAQGNGGGRQQSVATAGDNGVAAKDLFMTATASRTTVYEQEAILLTYKVYTLVDLTQLDGKLPTMDGFQIQEVPLPRTKEFQLEQYNGRNYRSVVWTQYVLFPQKTGKLTIPSVTYEGVVVTRNRNLDPIEAFFNGQSGLMELKRKIATPSLTIDVKELPAKPADFSGAVGRFAMSSGISAEDVDANDAITLKLSVKGTGNMKLISTPKVEWPKDFEAYDAKVNDNFQLTKAGLSGQKDFEFLAVPRHAGSYTIPAVKFVYFDTESHTYKTQTAGPYTINVKKGNGGNGGGVSNYSGGQQDVQQLNQDIRFIRKGETTYHKSGESMFGTGTHALGYIVPLVVFLLLIALGCKQAQANANIARRRDKKANKLALKKMKTAKSLLDAHDQGRFYDEVLRALWGYAADKLNLPQESLNRETVKERLLERGASAERVEQLMAVQSDCEFARYAPGDPNENMENIYRKAIDAITKMEEEL